MGMCCSGGMNPGAQLRLTQSAHLQRDSTGHHWANARNLLICLCLTFAILLLLILLLLILLHEPSQLEVTVDEKNLQFFFAKTSHLSGLKKIVTRTCPFMTEDGRRSRYCLFLELDDPSMSKLCREMRMKWKRNMRKNKFHKSVPVSEKAK